MCRFAGVFLCSGLGTEYQSCQKVAKSAGNVPARQAAQPNDERRGLPNPTPQEAAVSAYAPPGIYSP
jgi:hypothetical protein